MWRDVIEGDARWSCEAADCRSWLASLPADSVHCWVTSPPYYSLRDYGHADQIGREESPQAFVDELVGVFSESRRALHPSGCLWLNLGDSYANDAKGPNGMPGPGLDGAANQAAVRKPWRSDGVKKKDLLMIPSRVAMALQADGWYLRSACPWVKRNPMPESVTDRPGNGCEWVFLLAKRPDYFFDMEAVRRQAQERIETDTPIRRQVESGTAGRREGGGNDGLGNNGGARNLRTSDLWFDSVGMLLADTDEPDLLGFDVTPERYKGAHFACVDADTEMLTAAGWKRHDQVASGDTAAQFDVGTGRLSWGPVLDVYRYDVTAQEMVTAESRDLNMILTPNHRTIIRDHRATTRHGKPSRLRVVRADEVLGRHIIPIAAEWDQTTTDAPVTVDEAELIGWAMAEGSHPRDGRVVIYQSDSANPEKVDRIRGLLGAVGATWREYVRERTYRGRPHNVRQFNISGRVAELLGRWTPRDKPDFAMLGWPAEHLSRLFSGVIAGDGHRRADGRIGFTQVSEATTDFVQAVGFRLGYTARKSAAVYQPVACGAAEGYNVRPGFRLYFTRKKFVSLRGTNGEGQTIGRREYTGVVWCPRLPHGTFVARREGRVFITGNTMPTRLVAPMVLAGTSARGVCPHCGEPWTRAVAKERKATRPGTDSKVRSSGQTGGPYCPPGQAPHSNARKQDDATGRHDQVGFNARWKAEQVGNRDPERHVTTTRTVGWEQGCECPHAEPVPAVVGDMFTGSGTVAQVAVDLGRRFVGAELNPEYHRLIAKRLGKVTPSLLNC